MNNILTIKIFGDIEHKYGPYFRIGYRDKEATFNLLDKDRNPIDDTAIANELVDATKYVGYWLSGKEGRYWIKLCAAVRGLYLQMRQDHE